MPRLIVAVECDFRGYKPFECGGCVYNHFTALESIRVARDIVTSECGGKAAFLVHTSPFIRRNFNDIFFTSLDYLAVWSEIVSRGGEIGLHFHEEEPDGSCFYYHYQMHMENVVANHVRLLAEAGLHPTCVSMGYFGLNEWIVPILESNGIFISLDNTGVLSPFMRTNWVVAPLWPYHPDASDITQEGKCQLLILPMGMTEHCRGEDGLMMGSNSFRYLKSLWRAICEATTDEDVFFLWVEAHRLPKAQRKLRSVVRFVVEHGARLTLPTDMLRSVGITARV